MLQKSLISDKIDERIFIYSNNFLGKRAKQKRKFQQIYLKKNKVKNSFTSKTKERNRKRIFEEKIRWK